MKVSASGNCWGESPGDTGQMLYLAGMVRRKSKIENVAPALIGNRYRFRDVRIEAKRILMAAKMSVETRLLDQLMQVTKFSFLVTRLALSWKKEGG